MSFGIVQPNKNSINSDIRFEIYVVNVVVFWDS